MVKSVWGVYTYYWSDQSDDTRLLGVAIAIFSRLQSFAFGVTPVDEHMMLKVEAHFELHISCCRIHSYRDV